MVKRLHGNYCISKQDNSSNNSFRQGWKSEQRSADMEHYPSPSPSFPASSTSSSLSSPFLPPFLSLPFVPFPSWDALGSAVSLLSLHERVRTEPDRQTYGFRCILSFKNHAPAIALHCIIFFNNQACIVIHIGRGTYRCGVSQKEVSVWSDFRPDQGRKRRYSTYRPYTPYRPTSNPGFKEV